MRRYVACIFTGILALALVNAATGIAEAGIVLGGSPDVGVVFEGQAEFRLSGGNVFTLEDTFIGKSFSRLTPIETIVSYEATDLDFGAGFRWTEVIENDTTLAWTDFHVEITDGTGTFFQDQFSPFEGSIGFSNSTPIITQLSPDNGTQVQVAGDGRTVWFFPGQPVLPGDFLVIHIPIENLPESGSFTLRQHPSPVPEPGTLLLIGSGLVGLGAGARRRNRRK